MLRERPKARRARLRASRGRARETPGPDSLRRAVDYEEAFDFAALQSVFDMDTQP
jgi:hypothetical protein